MKYISLLTFLLFLLIIGILILTLVKKKHSHVENFSTQSEEQFIYNYKTKDWRLCGKDEESPNTKMEWKGVDCGNGNIEWQSMKSVANRIDNKTLEECNWTRHDEDGDQNIEWINNWLGQCGKVPTNVPDLPKEQFLFDYTTGHLGLCADEEKNTKVEWKGVDCGNGKIQWQSMKSVANRKDGTTEEQCSWRRKPYDKDKNNEISKWNNDWLGQCGVSPNEVPNLPKEQFVYKYKTNNSSLCGDGVNKNTDMEWKGVDCGDGKIQWQSMKSVANRKDGTKIEQCSWRRKPYDEDKNLWNKKYVGSCGVAPEQAKDLPKEQFVYKYKTKNPSLCGDDVNKNTDVEWKGVDCGDGNIQWQSMKTVANRKDNKTLEECSWTRKPYDEDQKKNKANSDWNNNWFGQCGKFPTNVTDLPTKQFVYKYKTKNSSLCGDGENKNTDMEWKGVDCGDGNIQWQSMKSVANRKDGTTVEQCSWRRKPYDEDKNLWNKKYVGSCGVAPEQAKDLPTKVAQLNPTTISTTTTTPITTSTTTIKDPNILNSVDATTTTTTTTTTTSTTTTIPPTTSTTTTIPPTTSTTTFIDDPMCRFIPIGETPKGCVAECLSPRNKNFGGDRCTRNICEAKCSECKNSILCKWLVQSEYSNDKIKLEGIEGNKRVQLYWNISNIKVNDLKEFIIYYKNTYSQNINAGISIKTIPFTQNKNNYSIVIDNLDNSTDYSFVVNVVNKTDNIKFISNTVNLIPNSNTKLIL